jgi:hypothetical protein
MAWSAGLCLSACAERGNPSGMKTVDAHTVGHHELTNRRGCFEVATIAKIKDAIRWAFDL